MREKFLSFFRIEKNEKYIVCFCRVMYFCYMQLSKCCLKKCMDVSVFAYGSKMVCSFLFFSDMTAVRGIR